MEKTRVEFWGILGTNIAVLAIVVALFTWSRTESRADYKDLKNSMETNLIAIQQEMKDFHGRLCAIEEKYHQLERK